MGNPSGSYHCFILRLLDLRGILIFIQLQYEKVSDCVADSSSVILRSIDIGDIRLFPSVRVRTDLVFCT